MKYYQLFFSLLLIKSNSLLALPEKGKKYVMSHSFFLPQKITILGSCNEVFWVDGLEAALAKTAYEDGGDQILDYLKICFQELGYSQETIESAFQADSDKEILNRLSNLISNTRYAGTFYYGVINNQGYCVHETWIDLDSKIE